MGQLLARGTNTILKSGTIPAGSPATASAAEPKAFIRGTFCWDEQPAYLFDIDGTLLRSQDRIHYSSFFSSVKSVTGADLVLDEVIMHGNTDPGILQDAFRAAKLDDQDWHPLLEQILEAMRLEVLAQREAMRPRVMPGVVATLAHLQAKGAALGVATGNLELIGWLKIEVAGLRDWFSFGGFSDRFAIRAEMIGHAAAIARAIAGTDASVCVVGDTPFDISAAKANSLPVIAVATGQYSFEELLEFNPDVCATTLTALLEPSRRRA